MDRTLPKISILKLQGREVDGMAVMPEPGGPGGPLAPSIFGRSVNPIPTGKGRLSPPITTGTPNDFHLPASLWWLHHAGFFEKLSLFNFLIIFSD